MCVCVYVCVGCLCVCVCVSASVEEDRVWVSVGHLCHVFQDVLLGDDAQQPPERKRGRTKTQRKMTIKKMHMAAFEGLTLYLFGNDV